MKKLSIIVSMTILILAVFALYLVGDNNILSKIVIYLLFPIPVVILTWKKKSSSLYLGSGADSIAKVLFVTTCALTIGCVIISFISNAKEYKVTHLIFITTFIFIFAFLFRIHRLSKKKSLPNDPNSTHCIS